MIEIRALTGIIFTIGVFAATNTTGATICGPIQGDEIKNDLFYEQYPVNTAFCSTHPTSTSGSYILPLDNNYEWACVQYDNIIADALPHVFMTSCSVTEYGCGPDSYLDSGGCTKCPNGTAVMENDGMHQQTQCRNDLCQKNYFYVPQISRCIQCNEDSHSHAANHNNNFCNCNENYYWEGTMCLPCPDDGRTPAAQNTATVITQCYLNAGDYNDQTGDFTIIGGKCYYEK